MGEYAEVIEWDVLNGDVLGALIRCPDCPCVRGQGCDGDGVLHREYRLPGDAPIDTYADADLLIQVLDRHLPQGPDDSQPEGGA